MAFEKDQLIGQLSRARAGLSQSFDGIRGDVVGIRHQLDLVAKLRQSFARHKPFWLAGAGILGLVLAKFPSRKKKIYLKAGSDKKIAEAAGAGIVAILLKFALSSLRPAVSSFALKKATNWMSSRTR